MKGTCVGPITVSRDLKIVGKSGRGFGRATIDGDHRGSVLTIQSHTTVTIRGLLVTNGTAPMGGGIYAQPSSVRLVDTVVKGNSATGLDSASGGGGVAIDGGILTLVDSTIRHNTAAAHGGGIYVGLHGGADLFARGTSSVRGNHAGLDGGGIYIQTHSRATFSDSSSIAGNAADQRGGGVTCGDCGGVTLSGDSSIHDNTAGVGGGGLQSGGTGVPLQMQDRSSIHDNTAPIGGGVWLVLRVAPHVRNKRDQREHRLRRGWRCVLGVVRDDRARGRELDRRQHGSRRWGWSLARRPHLAGGRRDGFRQRELGDQGRWRLPRTDGLSQPLRQRLRDRQLARQLLPARCRRGCTP